jgi:prevent-host-death family protein
MERRDVTQPQMPRTTTTNSGLTIGAHDAKTNLGQLLDRVEHGEAFVITRHGEPIARLVPFAEPIDEKKVGRAIDRLLALQKTQTLGGVSIEDTLHDGHDL